MSDTACDIASAHNLLETQGEPVTMREPDTGGFDPVTGEPVPVVPGASYQGFGYPGRYVAGEIDGTNVRANDVRLVLEKLAARPQAGWLAVVDGVTYRVMDARPIRKAGVDIITICQLRAS